MSDAHSSDKAAKTQRVIGKPFAPGQSGNPAGRPMLPEEFKAKGVDALMGIVGLMASEDEAIALKARTWVAERIFGKAAQSVDVTGDLAPVAQALLELAKKKGGE